MIVLVGVRVRVLVMVGVGVGLAKGSAVFVGPGVTDGPGVWLGCHTGVWLSKVEGGTSDTVGVGLASPSTSPGSVAIAVSVAATAVAMSSGAREVPSPEETTVDNTSEVAPTSCVESAL